MTTLLIRWCATILFCLLLASCSSLPMMKLPQSAEAEFFIDALDQYIESGSLSALKRLPEHYPDGKWRARAETIIAMAERQKPLQARTEKSEQLLAGCQHEKDILLQENQMLENTLAQLKELLIDMELRAD